MRKPVIALVVALVGMLVAAPVADAAPSAGDTKRACADVVNGRVNYQSTTATSAEVLGQIDLRADACKNLVYTLTVYAGTTDVDVVVMTVGVPVAATMDAPPRVEFRTPVSPLADVCVVFTTSKSNGDILDSAPDSSCVAVPINSDNTGLTRFK